MGILVVQEEVTAVCPNNNHLDAQERAGRVAAIMEDAETESFDSIMRTTRGPHETALFPTELLNHKPESTGMDSLYSRNVFSLSISSSCPNRICGKTIVLTDRLSGSCLHCLPGRERDCRLSSCSLKSAQTPLCSDTLLLPSAP
jgi:hypothetical protein